MNPFGAAPHHTASIDAMRGGEMARLKGKVAVVTGASRRIGAGIAEKLAGEDAATVVNYATSDSDAQKIVSRNKSHGGRAVAVRADISKLADILRPRSPTCLFTAATKPRLTPLRRVLPLN
jgi:short subunit dehydrogenase